LLKITAAIKGLVRQKLENLDDNLSFEALLEQLEIRPEAYVSVLCEQERLAKGYNETPAQ